MEELPDIKQKGKDTFLGFAKAGINLIPLAGTFIAETVSNIIPNQRLDRVCKYLEIISKKISELSESEKVFRQLMDDKNILFLFEKSIKYSSETINENKYDYYAEFIISSVNDKTTEQMQKERMLDILSELNEIEIILLIYYSLSMMTLAEKEKNEFIQKNKAILFPRPQTMTEPVEKGYAYKFQQQYIENLEKFHLISRELEVDNRSQIPKIDPFSRRFETSSPRITTIGDLLINFIGGEKYK